MMKGTSVMLSVLLSIALLTVSCTKQNIGGETGEVGGEKGQGSESGMMWGINDLAEEFVSGIRLILVYDAPSGSFTGFIENTTIDIVRQVRVKVQIFDAAGNSKVYGPTIPVDMASGDVRDVSIPAPQAGNFVTFSMFPEVG